MVDTDARWLDETGGSPEHSRLVKTRFDRYVVTIKLGPSDEFLEIVEIELDKTFLSQQQKRQAFGSHDVSDLYDL
jgi:hypothetical protein